MSNLRISSLAIASISACLFSCLGFGQESPSLEKPIHFSNDVVPIFTKYGCNSGGCHGRASGQNGFKLSLFGYEPLEDYQHLVNETRGRRILPNAPQESLLLKKATNEVPHVGGKRIEVGSKEYVTLANWIRQGMNYGSPEPKLVRIEVTPASSILPKQGTQQIQVQAFYNDGAERDVTTMALYDPVDKAMASINDVGLVKVNDIVGDAAITVRYQGQVGVFRARVPKGEPLKETPSPNNFIDTHVFNKLKSLGIQPSETCDDPTFLRRVTLDIAGRLPTLQEVERFLSNSSESRRQDAIDRLLDSEEYAEFFANKWNGLLRNRREDPSFERGCVLLWQWIRDSFLENKSYDTFVRELITASGDVTHNPPVAWYRTYREPHLQMEDTAQVFLGTRLQCAQCHHHLFEKWSQEDYLSMAAFFSQVTRKSSGTSKNASGNNAEDIVVHKRGDAQMVDKKSQQVFKPAALGSPVDPLAPDEDPRRALADWMTDVSNPYFARAIVNRYWKHFLGKGLIEPEDDLRDTNPPTNPELLDALASDFVGHGYDLKHLIRTITQSRIYQLSAEPNEDNADDQQNFAKFYPKRLMAEVLLDSVDLVTKTTTNFKNQGVNTRAVALPDNSFNQGNQLLSVFGRPDAASACECERTMEASLSQSLHLLNADELQNKLANENGRAALLAKETRPAKELIREVYLLALAREPNDEEILQSQSYLDSKSERKEGEELKKAKRRAWEDLLWAMINSKEFLFNH
jgi:hypothetical protein